MKNNSKHVVAWILNSLIFYQDIENIYFENNQVDDENPEELILNNVTHNDEGWYTCVAANSLGNTAASAYLHVIDGNTNNRMFFQEDSHCVIL